MAARLSGLTDARLNRDVDADDDGLEGCGSAHALKLFRMVRVGLDASGPQRHPEADHLEN